MKKYFFFLILLGIAAVKTQATVDIGDFRYSLNGSYATIDKYIGNSPVCAIPEKITYNSVVCTVTSIESNAFKDCTGLTSITIPNSITSIGGSAFSGCVGLTSITIPNSVKSIGSGAFKDCIGLTSIEIPNLVTSIGDRAFSGCVGLTSITIPNSVKSIGSGAFYGCTGLTSLEIPSSVTSIGSGAFDGCKVLINMSNSVMSIGSSAFSGCTELSINIIDSVTNIGNAAFYGFTSLTSITIPNSVTSIGDRAFSGCTGLTTMNIPNSVTSIGSRAFEGCTGLPVINGIRYAGTFAVRAIYNNVSTYTIKEGTKFIGADAFSGCVGLTSIEIPNSVTSIGDRAFSGCTGLTSITIPNSVTSIGEEAFVDCEITDFIFEEGKDTIILKGSRIFYSNYNERSGYERKFYSSPFYSIATTYSGYPGFEYDTIIKRCCIESLYIGRNIVFVGSDKEDCYSEMGREHSKHSYGDLPISPFDFLKTVTIGKEVTNIPHYLFLDVRGLNKVDIPDLAAWCGINFVHPLSYAHLYLNGTEVTDLVIPNSVTSIGSNAFSGCTGLTSVSIPNSVTGIGSNAFSGCTGLTSVEIPKSVTSIGNYAFYNSNNILSVRFMTQRIFTISPTVFSCQECATLYVPTNLVSRYKNLYGWKEFRNIEGIEDTTTLFIKIAATNGGKILVEGCTSIEEGYMIVDKGDDITISFDAVEGHKLLFAAVNGKNVIADLVDNTYTIEKVSDDISIAAIFERVVVPTNLDPNKDGRINTADVVAIYNYIITGEGPSDDTNPAHIDPNKDGKVNTADVVAIYNYIITGEAPLIESFEVNDVSMSFVSIEEGVFTMGATAEQANPKDNEQPAHAVMLNTFSIGKTEVTQALWNAVMDYNPSTIIGDDLPVNNVDWNDCQDFINRLNSLLSDKLEGRKFRLPTEAEWEYAARGGALSKGYQFSGSNKVDDVSWYKNNCEGTIQPVASLEPNELGLYDMSGNVHEWCQDWYDETYYAKSPTLNPQGPESGVDRVLRSGSWRSAASLTRVAFRHFGDPNKREDWYGLRLVLAEKQSNSFEVRNVNIDFVPVKGGLFTMGATAEQANPKDNEQPAHAVMLNTFSIGKTEVIQALWNVVMDYNPSTIIGDDLPVNNVDWNDCQNFIRRLNSLLSDKLEGRKFRLPTEAEWEYAARGGALSKGYQFSGSNKVDDVSWYKNNCEGAIQPVASLEPNELGLYDMSGNVHEWCQDWYDETYYAKSPTLNPQGPESGADRVLRSGSWRSAASLTRVAFRHFGDPNKREDWYGLRLVLAEEQ